MLTWNDVRDSIRIDNKIHNRITLPIGVTRSGRLSCTVLEHDSTCAHSVLIGDTSSEKLTALSFILAATRKMYSEELHIDVIDGDGEIAEKLPDFISTYVSSTTRELNVILRGIQSLYEAKNSYALLVIRNIEYLTDNDSISVFREMVEEFPSLGSHIIICEKSICNKEYFEILRNLKCVVLSPTDRESALLWQKSVAASELVESPATLVVSDAGVYKTVSVPYTEFADIGET